MNEYLLSLFGLVLGGALIAASREFRRVNESIVHLAARQNAAASREHMQDSRLAVQEIVTGHESRRITELEGAHEQLYGTYKASTDELHARLEPLEVNLETRRARTARARSVRAEGASA